jgi:hypothetical protein
MALGGVCPGGVPGNINATGLYQATNDPKVVGCKANVWASVPGTPPLASNVVTITNTAKKLISIAILPANPTVPYLVNHGAAADACGNASGDKLGIRFILVGTYVGGQQVHLTTGTQQWISTSTGTATINPTSGLATLTKQSSIPTGNATTTIHLSYTDGTYSSNASTLLTVVPGQVTALTVSPASATVAKGSKVALNATASFGAATFDVTDLGDPLAFPKGAFYEGWKAATFTTTSGTSYLDATGLGINATTHKYELKGVAATTAAEKVTATVCGTGGSLQSGNAMITVSP